MSTNNLNDETQCKWVSSRGLLKICDRHNKNPQSSSRNIDPDILDNLKDFDVLHICSWLSISIFMTNYADKIDKKVIIVTNDSDFDAPIFEKPVGVGDEINKEAILNFLNSDKCIHWFTQNCTLNHPKVTPIPIGMDYHTFSPTISCIDQEKMLNNIKESSKHFSKRIVKCYGNFHFNMDGKYYTNDRYDCYNNVNKELVNYEENIVMREETWKNQIKYAFVLSPSGGGYDCHRTWEALILGCIPIVKRHNLPFERIYDELPVLMVSDWKDISKGLLEITIKKFSKKTFNYDKLSLEYWKNKFNSYKKIYDEEELINKLINEFENDNSSKNNNKNIKNKKSKKK